MDKKHTKTDKQQTRANRGKVSQDFPSLFKKFLSNYQHRFGGCQPDHSNWYEGEKQEKLSKWDITQIDRGTMQILLKKI